MLVVFLSCFLSSFSGTKVFALGTKEAPWLISKPEHLLLVNQHPEDHFRVTANLNMVNVNIPTVNIFSGVIDGQGYTVSNWTRANNWIRVNEGTIKNFNFNSLRINLENRAGNVLVYGGQQERPNNGGLLNLNAGTVENIVFNDMALDVDGRYNSDAYTRWANPTTTASVCYDNFPTGVIRGVEVKNLRVTGNSHSAANRNTAGIANYNRGIVEHCIFRGVMETSATSRHAGIVNTNGELNKAPAIVRFCYNFADIITTGWPAGIANENMGLIIYCGNFGDIHYPNNTSGDYGDNRYSAGITSREWGVTHYSFNAGYAPWGIVHWFMGHGVPGRGCYSLNSVRLTPLINSLNNKVYDGTSFLLSNHSEEFFKSQAIIDGLTPGGEKIWGFTSSPLYNYPIHIGTEEIAKDNWSIPYFSLGDNTDLLVDADISVPFGFIWDLVDVSNKNNKTVLRRVENTPHFKGRLAVPVAKDRETDVQSFIWRKERLFGGIISLSEGSVKTIDSRNVLSNLLDQATGIGFESFFVFVKRDRYFENNSLNRQLVDNLLKKGVGFFLMGSNNSPVLNPLFK